MPENRDLNSKQKKMLFTFFPESRSPNLYLDFLLLSFELHFTVQRKYQIYFQWLMIHRSLNQFPALQRKALGGELTIFQLLKLDKPQFPQ